MKRDDQERQSIGTGLAAATEIDLETWLQRLRQEVNVPEREFRLYVRYLRSLALLCECAPYVDEADYLELIDELLADACAHYPLDCQRQEHYRAIAPRFARAPLADSLAPPPDG